MDGSEREPDHMIVTRLVRFFMTSARSVFAKQVGVTFLSQGLSMVFMMITAAITARWLGPVGKGEYALALMIPGVLQLVLGFGINASNVYFAGSGKVTVPKLAANGIIFTLAGTILGFLIVIGLLKYHYMSVIVPGVQIHFLLLGLLILPIYLLNANMTSLLLGLRHMTGLAVLNTGQAMLVPILSMIFIVWLRLGVPGAILASLGSNIALMVATVLVLRAKVGKNWYQWDRQVVKPVMSYGMRAYVANLLQFFNYRLDTFIVNAFIGPGGVGIYASAVTLAELLWQLPNSVGMVVFPKAAGTDSESMNRFTPRLVLMVMGLSSLGALALLVFGKIIIQYLLSEAFLGAYLPMLVLLPGVVLLGAGKIISADISGRGFPQYNSFISGFSLVVTVVLDLLLIPRMGIIGAALASSVAYALTFILLLVFYMKTSKLVL